MSDVSHRRGYISNGSKYRGPAIEKGGSDRVVGGEMCTGLIPKKGWDVSHVPVIFQKFNIHPNFSWNMSHVHGM